MDRRRRSPRPRRSGVMVFSALAARPAQAGEFTANRRGFWSFWLFMAMFLCSLGSEFIANDRPILALYKNELLFPAFVAYPEEKFGGFLAHRLPRSDHRDGNHLQRLDDVAADPLLL